MQHFPIFLDTAQRRILLSGGGEAAIAKLRLLLKTAAQIEVYARNPAAEITAWAKESKLRLMTRDLQDSDLAGAVLIYAADEDDLLDMRTKDLALRASVLLNVVDDLENSEFITPAIVDRDPVTIAIGTEGAAPVLARKIKADLEERLPVQLGTLARIGKSFRHAAEALPFGRKRRDFWRAYYETTGPRAVVEGEEAVTPALQTLLDEHLGKDKREGHVAFVGAGPGDPELLTLKARRLLDEADVVIYDRLVGTEILELARREAIMIDVGKIGFGPSTSQENINALIADHGAQGHQVVRLKGGDCTVFGRLDEEIDTLDAKGISWQIVPGITAASASVAALGQSLTKRGRNASVRLITGHDMKGFADHDWADLARAHQVAAIYMGKKAARFIQGRLLMHGASPSTPISLVENASLPTQHILGTTLADLSKDLAKADLNGPVLTFLGLAPRAAALQTQDMKQELA